MKQSTIFIVFSLFLVQLLFAQNPNNHRQTNQSPNNHYHFAKSSPDGIGKFYMGREISHVMGHLAAGWLERSKREQEERVSLLVEALELKAGDKVADIGVGTGYIARKMA